MVPHLVTAMTGPINEFEQRVLDSMPAIERWFRLEWMEHTPPFYSAASLRNAGFKLAAVETSLYPSGWNNLAPEVQPLAVQAAMAAIEKICPEARNLLLVPENRASDSAYLSSLAQLRRIFHMAGLNVRIGSIDPAIKKTTRIELSDGQSVTLEPVIRSKRRLGVKDFDPCTILLNNDLRAGIPGILEELHEQYLLPPLQAGWTTRRKSQHLKCYEEVAKRMGKLLGIDPWLIHPLFEKCGADDFGGECLATKVDAVLGKTRRKYKEYGIKEKPYVVIKSDDAAQQPALRCVRSVKELAALPSAMNSMPKSGGAQGLLIQEGILSQERSHEALAEPVVYMMDRYVVGGFYRLHDQGVDGEDGGTPDANYLPLAFEHGTHLPQPGIRAGASAPNRFYMYGVVARLAMLAASYELEVTNPEAELY